MKKNSTTFLQVVILIACVLFYTKGLAQPSKSELYKITQVPPNAASLGKYGEIPVGFYTGIPSINIPFYEINAGRIKVPIGISYHAGGIKVEEMASQVGLGWSLNAGGVITRTVMGLPDEKENAGGYTFFNPEHSVNTLIAMPGGSMPYSEFNILLKKVILNMTDAEPDVFYFNFGSISGKFLYDQTDHKFYTVPYSKLKIEFSSSSENMDFTLTDENGFVYFFNNQEVSHRDANGEGIRTPTSWYLSSIYDPVSKETVSFHYESYITNYPTMSSETHYISSLYYNSSSAFTKTLINQQEVTYHLMRLKTIEFSSGYVSFEHTLSRCDIPGDKALTHIKVSNNERFIKIFDLNYDYYLASYGSYSLDCNNKEASVFKRLKLISIDENSTSGTSTTPKTHTMEYNENLPSRLSKAQDHWGYYNGQYANQYLYPQAVFGPWNMPYILPGGDRSVYPNYSQAGIIRKITYPTGGYSMFEFENNTVHTGIPPVAANTKWATLFSGEDDTYVESTFTVSSSSGCITDGTNDSGGGAYITMQNGFDFNTLRATGFPGLAIVIKIINTDTNVEGIYYQVSAGVEGGLGHNRIFYLPNGNYKLIIDLADNPIRETRATSVHLSWIQCNQVAELDGMYVGGLRVKKVTNYEDPLKVATIKTYKYGKESNPLESSGECHFYPSYSHNVVYFHGFSPDNSNFCLKRFSSSNYPLVSENGKSAGYSNVIEENGPDGANGYTQYSYTNYSQYDDVRTNYLPGSLPISYQWLRGSELGRKVFKKTGSPNSYELVSETINEYDTQLLGTGKKTFNGLRGMFFFDGSPLEAPNLDLLLFPDSDPRWEIHPVYSDFVYLKKTKERNYTGAAYVETVKDYTYNTKNLLPSKVETVDSHGEKTFVHTKYPTDFSVAYATNPKSAGIQRLKELNFISPTIEQFVEKQEGENKRLMGATFSSYLPNEPLVDTVFTLYPPLSGILNYPGISASTTAFAKNSNYQPEIIVEKYDTNNRLLQQKKANNSSLAYIWGYDGTLPIAEVKNAASNEIFYSGFEDTGTTGTAHTGNKYYNGDFALSWTLPNSRVYLISYWYRSEGVWFYKKQTYSGAVTLLDGDAIDDIRIYPIDAQMTTYTYIPLVGITSITDAKDQTTYYEYDEFQRLKNIKDQNGKIVKNYDYHYKP